MRISSYFKATLLLSILGMSSAILNASNPGEDSIVIPQNHLVTGVIENQYERSVDDTLNVVVIARGYKVLKTKAIKGLFQVDFKGIAEPGEWIEVLIPAQRIKDENGKTEWKYKKAHKTVLLGFGQNLYLEVDREWPKEFRLFRSRYVNLPGMRGNRTSFIEEI